MEDIREYNRVAQTVMDRYHISVHDLFGFTAGRPELFRKDGLHFTDEGYQVLGGEVGGEIAGFLA